MIGDRAFIDGFYNKHRRSQAIILDPFHRLYDWSADLLRFILTLLCGGCNNTATKRISKTASTTSISKTQRATRRFNVWSNISIIAVLFIMTQLLASSEVDAMVIRPRQLKKRHSISYTETSVDWENPCGGVFEGTRSGERMQKQISINLLRKATRDTYKTLNATSDRQPIDTSDIATWSAHKATYKFLPKLRTNSSVALKRWYRNMQTFVAAFSYLRTTQHKFDEVKLNNRESEISQELKTLLYDARTILCEIESTINHTTPINREKKFTSMSVEAMNKRLKFRTKKHLGDNVYQVDKLDLMFVKFYFMEFLETMWGILKHNRHSIYNGSNSLSISDRSYANSNSKSVSSNEINASRKRGGRKRPARKQKHNKPRQRLHKNTSMSAA